MYVECPICQFGYDGDDDAQVTRHTDYCDKRVNGYPLAQDDEDQIVWSSAPDEVRETSTRQSRPYRQRVADAYLFVQEDFPDYPSAYDGSDSDLEYDGRAYVYCRHDRVVGLAIVRRRAPSALFSWPSPGTSTAMPLQESPDPRWALDRIWTLARLRKTGIGRDLLQIVTHHLGITTSDIGYVEPFSADGERFVRHVAPLMYWSA